MASRRYDEIDHDTVDECVVCHDGARDVCPSCHQAYCGPCDAERHGCPEDDRD
jgi:hypothetical protein